MCVNRSCSSQLFRNLLVQSFVSSEFVLNLMASASSGPYYRAGGRRQRQVRREQKEQLVAVAVVQQLVKSEIAKHILQKWAWGLYSGAEVQRLAMCHVTTWLP